MSSCAECESEMAPRKPPGGVSLYCDDCWEYRKRLAVIRDRKPKTESCPQCDGVSWYRAGGWWLCENRHSYRNEAGAMS